METQRSVLCIQDLSCVGRSSLAAAAPALAAMGVQPVALPTALLSTHTGGFGAPARTDERAFLSGALAHFQQLGLTFDGVCSGYLADAGAAALVERAFRQSPGALKLVDPAMGDGGRLYRSVTQSVCAAQLGLCEKADVIVPNATEAALLLAEDPAGADGSDALARAEALLRRFPGLRLAVVTGARAAQRRGNVCAARGAAARFLPYPAAPQDYPGTGDLFAAVLAGGLVRGLAPERAVELAARFVAAAAQKTCAAQGDPRFGVRFEPLLGTLAAWTQDACAARAPDG